MKSTFAQDFSIADAFGAAAVKDTYKRSQEWLPDAEMWGELTVVLNHKIWQHYKTNEPLARVYNDLWSDATDRGWKEYEGDEERSRTYFRITD